MNILRLLTTLTMTVSLTSCQPQTNADWKVDIGIENVGTNMIKETFVMWGEFRFAGGFVSPSNKTVHVSFDHPIPETATVHYSLPNGKDVTKTLPVKRSIPAAAHKDRDITVMFEVNSNTDEIIVNVLHFIQKDGYSQLVPFDHK